MGPNREHFRAIIYYNFQRQLSQQECLAELLSVFGNEAPHQSTTFRWYGEFKLTQENVHAVRKHIIEDRHVTYREIEACLPKVITELRKINPERRIILHQHNASSHTAQKTRQYLTEENVELLDHPPYSPDLSPSDFFTFPKIKNILRGQRFQLPEEAVDALKNAVLDLPTNDWNKCFENWFKRMQMCINLRGEYFQKQ
ncbi:unnamed protein product [Acanthoscelides obtectus]|uniref:Transposase n=1 Tax=Acanthoscelides obtectus TaxID=200917 RepID=A0A9P0Q5E7_ACAOB|nr:unnamed protein product [Acanthoscelides obtectus]CAK1635791.1 Histone-lysine N-methyltransferase SETMAR [Acanthoscelides obtectus]